MEEHIPPVFTPVFTPCSSYGMNTATIRFCTPRVNPLQAVE